MAGIKPDLPAAGLCDKLMAIVNNRDLWQITNKKPVIIAGVARRIDMFIGKAELAIAVTITVV